MTQVQNKEENKKKNRLLIIIIILLLIGVGVLFYLYMKESNELKDTTPTQEQIDEKEAYEAEIDSIMSEYNQKKAEYAELDIEISEKDSLILANVEEIKRLISSQAGYKKIKKQRDILRGMIQGYVLQLDSLYTENKELKQEVQYTRQELRDERKKLTNQKKENENLQGKVEIASMLKAYNIKTSAFRLRGSKKREDETDKAKNVDRIKVCFTVGQNMMTKAGDKVAYIRISRPDGRVITKSRSDVFQYNGEILNYSLKKEFKYTNNSKNICVQWDKGDSSVKPLIGNYDIVIFVDGYEIGQSRIKLK